MIDRDPTNITSTAYIEKRDFIRMKINTPAQVSVEQGGITTEGICNDLSGNGMLLTLDNNPPLDSELLVTIATKASQQSTLQARCTIARVQQAANNKSLVGLEIQEIIDEEESLPVE